MNATTQSMRSPTPADLRLEAALDQIRDLLVEGETLDTWSVQPRIKAFLHRRVIIAATSGRFIFLRRNLLSGYSSDSVRWQDMKECAIKAGWFSAELTFTAQIQQDMNASVQANRFWRFRSYEKSSAQEIFKICQKQYQVWREKRRVREIEEIRAKSGGYNTSGNGDGGNFPWTPPRAAQGAPNASGAASESTFESRLRDARKALDAGLISDSEYQTLKAKIVADL